jgi:crotonobetainyl-CoA:carnitine CoA-transferase CaiB-like acyl-CoA transferase
VPFGPINNIKQTFDHPQAIARGVVVEVEVGVSVSFSYNFSILRPAPARRKD